MPHRSHAHSQHQQDGRLNGQQYRDLTRLIARLVAARWRQLHANPRPRRGPRTGFRHHN